MSEFSVYFQLGLEHITDPGGYDHALFLVTLAAVYQIADWKKVLLLATSFTLGHSLTLGFTAMGWRFIPPETVEVLIPITIMLTAIYNIAVPPKRSKHPIGSYLMALGFGLIHGMGFAGFFVSMMAGIQDNFLALLLYFNLGIEAGQIAIILVYLLITVLAIQVIKVPFRYWRIGISGLGGLMSIWLLIKVLQG